MDTIFITSYALKEQFECRTEDAAELSFEQLASPYIAVVGREFVSVMEETRTQLEEELFAAYGMRDLDFTSEYSPWEKGVGTIDQACTLAYQAADTGEILAMVVIQGHRV